MKTGTILTIFALFLALFLALACGSASDDDDDDTTADDDTENDDDDTADDDDSTADDDDAATGDDDNDDTDDDDDNTLQESIWYDSTSGLHWQNGSDAGTVHMTWPDAVDYCENLYWAGEMNWRLPTISELRSLVRGCPATETGGACGVTDECLSFDECYGEYEGPCAGCETYGAGEGTYLPDQLGDEYGYRWWSFSQISDRESQVWQVNFTSANMNWVLADNENREFFRCVY